MWHEEEPEVSVYTVLSSAVFAAVVSGVVFRTEDGAAFFCGSFFPVFFFMAFMLVRRTVPGPVI